jgi:hypothetical protein
VALPPEQPKSPSRLRLALLNAWNLAALSACGALAFLTKNPVPLMAGAALEAGWLAFATRPRASAMLFARQHEAMVEASANARRAALLASLPHAEVDRVRRLDERREDIVRLCSDHKHLARDVLMAEVARLDDVIEAFMDLALDAHRSEAYLASIDVADLESETRRSEENAARAADEDARKLARKSLDVLLRRRDQVDELRQKIQRTRAQLELIESTFRMIANEIMLMRTTEELRGQLDDLVVGVQAVREIALEGEDSDADRARRAAAASAPAAVRRG